MARTIMVKAAPSLGNRVAMFERHPSHPGGEVFVAGQDSAPVEVAADTPEVTSALDDKRIVVLEGAALKQAQEVAKAADERRMAARESARAALNPDAAADAKRIADLEARLARAEASLSDRQAQYDATVEKQQAAEARKA